MKKQFMKTLKKLLSISAAISHRREAVIKKGKVFVINSMLNTKEEREIIGYKFIGKTKIPLVKLNENEEEIGRSLDDSIIYIAEEKPL